MYHLILVATLIAGGTKEIPAEYYDSKAECMNKATEAPNNLERNKDFCKYIKDEWFPDQARVRECNINIDPIQSVVGKCVEEN